MAIAIEIADHVLESRAQDTVSKGIGPLLARLPKRGPMDARLFWKTLKGRGFTFFAGVPDSTFQSAYQGMFNDPDIQYIPAVGEDVALGVASAGFWNSWTFLIGSSRKATWRVP